MIKKISENGIKLIKEFEGFSAKMYRCPAGHMTIGYGHKILKGEVFRELTEQDAHTLMLKDIEPIERYLSTILCNQDQFDAFCSFAYNFGIARLRASTLMQTHNNRRFKATADEFLKWIWARVDSKMIKMPGLLRRRLAESYLYQSKNNDIWFDSLNFAQNLSKNTSNMV